MSSKARELGASRVINAPARKIFAFLARPDNHVLLDTSGMIRGSADHATMTEMGVVFAMKPAVTVRRATPADVPALYMHNEMKGDHQVENHVVVYEPDRAIAGHQPSRVTSRRGTRGSGDLRP